MKILVLIQNTHPYSFSEEQVLSPTLEFCLNKVMNPEPPLLASEHFLIQCMVMVMSVVDCIHYKPMITGSVINGSVVSVEERKKNFAKVVDVMLKSILTGDRIVFLCNILIRRYTFFPQRSTNGILIGHLMFFGCGVSQLEALRS